MKHNLTQEEKNKLEKEAEKQFLASIEEIKKAIKTGKPCFLDEEINSFIDYEKKQLGID